MSVALRDRFIRDQYELVQFPIDTVNSEQEPKVRTPSEESDSSLSARGCTGSVEAAATRGETCIVIAKKIAEFSTKRIAELFICAGIIAGVGLQKNAGSLLIARAYFTFIGGGVLAPTIMLTTCLALKCIVFLNEKPDEQEAPFLHRAVSWLKQTPKDFASGVSQFPKMFRLKICKIVCSHLIVNRFKKPNTGHGGDLIKQTFVGFALKRPFLEELFFREIIQGSIISAMKIVNLVGKRLGKGAFIAEETISSVSRVISATCFGLAYPHQYLTEALIAGIASYFYETALYEKYGLSVSSSFHMANNAFVWIMRGGY